MEAVRAGCETRLFQGAVNEDVVVAFFERCGLVLGIVTWTSGKLRVAHAA